jgi:hypothetical protein
VSAIHKLINSVCNKEELPGQWKESIIVPVLKKGDKTDCNNYRRISLRSTLYKILSNIFLRRLSPYIEEIIGDYQCGFRRNRSTIPRISCIRQILEKERSTKRRDFMETYDSVRREVLYNILIQFGVPMKPVSLIKMCLNETYSKVRTGKHLSECFPVQNLLKQ